MVLAAGQPALDYAPDPVPNSAHVDRSASGARSEVPRWRGRAGEGRRFGL